MNIFGFDTLPSTNTYAIEHFDEYQHLDIIMAQVQTAGKGRKGRKWSSKTGGLYFTVILKPVAPQIEKLSSLTQIMAISVCKAVRKLGAKVYLKWPNDVLFEGKKICGILSEAATNGTEVKGLVIGVGVNIEQENIVSDKPFTSLKELGIKVSKSVLIESIISNFNNMPKENFRNNFKKLCPAFAKQITVDGKTGIFEDIDNCGRLILKTEKGLETIIAGDVNF